MEKRIKLGALKLNEQNPRTISKDAFAKLCESIKRDPQFMELRPIVVDKAGVIIGGNQRYRACVALGMRDVPASWVRRADKLTAEQRRRFIIVDNAPEGMAGEWDFDTLANEFELPELLELGFEEEDLIFEKEVKDKGQSEFITKYCIVITNKDEKEQHSLFDEFTERGIKCRLSNM